MESAWTVADPPDASIAGAIERTLELPGPVVRLLCRRGVTGVEEADRFLNPDLRHLDDPFRLVGVETAVERLDRALRGGERILVHGDYDVDGITATALLTRVLRGLGGKVDYFIPHRMRDGYGLSTKAVDVAAELGATLIVTADCGIGALEPVAGAASRGIDTIVTDHHEVGDTLPGAVAVVNPKRPDCDYSFKDFAGVGVAFKLLQGLIQSRGGGENGLLTEHLDFVALGTIADVVPLRGENRVLASCGLRRLTDPDKPGLRALLDRTGLKGRAVDSGHVAFVLAPRINAAGRLGDSMSSIELLLSTDDAESQRLAEHLERNNVDRRRLDESILDEAVAMVEALGVSEEAGPIVLWSEEWHSGVLGIVASKLVERFRVPAILIAVDGGIGRGSGRSVDGFDLVAALAGCDDLLEEWGGHKYAIGLKVRLDRLASFRERFVASSRPALTGLDRRPILDIEERLSLPECTRELALMCERLAPFGYENPEPVFMTEGLQLMEAPRRIGDRGQHLRITAYQDGHTRECIGFGMGEFAEQIDRPGQKFALAHVPIVNRWRGRETVQLKLKDIRTD